MSVFVALGCVRSCGVTTAAAALATVWPGDRRLLVVEADPAGGDLAARCALPPEPGLVSPAAAARRSSDPQLVWEHAHRLTPAVAALAGPVGAALARAALGLLTPLLGQLGALDADVLVDCGRLDPDSAVLPVWAGAPVRVLVTRPQLVDLHHAAEWLSTVPAGQRPTGLLLVGRTGYPPREIADTLGVPVIGEFPDDPAAVAAVPAGRSRTLNRSPLLRHARTVTDRLLSEPSAQTTAADARPAKAPDAAGTAATWSDEQRTEAMTGAAR